ncbi:TetR family transcriptional regulator [Cryobacterium sp. SO2]|uniref:TetR/AcrR family transcriptional regulator n=1 Tax=Cryobacterium sp. SO2 TaxID=1897060 RepID=UPI00223DE40C|nr:TetR/AcrR family transcriptional regulator [Cryobacterium sp. SO2]WEO77136.1 TetR family transcriptional regulator [Cryobacterium sp. SO2]
MRTLPDADAEHTPETEPTEQTGRSRDAGETRRLLLNAARRRFAHDGYTTTTVRDIAADAGVNVALINRYFVSKEGLFEACLRRVGEDLGRPANQGSTVEQILDSMVLRLTDLPGGDYTLHLLLLLRSSGDERADQIRLSTLRSFTEGIAAAAGWRPDTPDDGLFLRAQLALAATLGIVLLRSSTRLEPLASASADDLRAPLAGVLDALLSPREP